MGYFKPGNQVNKGRRHSPETKAKRLATLKERDPDGKRYEKASATRAANIATGAVVPGPCWNKGNHLTPEWAALIGRRAIERHFTNNMRPEICRLYKEENMTATEIAERLGTVEGVILRRLWEEGVEIRKGGWPKGKAVPSGTRKKLSESRKRKFKDPEFLKRFYQSMNIKPNKPETAILSLLESLYPGEWKYTGDFSFVVNGKCPDFVNCNGQKKIIELFGDYWHRGQNPEDRAAIFSPFGYETLVIWERELKDMEGVKRRIQDFHERTA